MQSLIASNLAGYLEDIPINNYSFKTFHTVDLRNVCVSISTRLAMCATTRNYSTYVYLHRYDNIDRVDTIQPAAALFD